VSPRAREDSVRPRLQSGGGVRPLSFTVRTRDPALSTRQLCPSRGSPCVGSGAMGWTQTPSSAILCQTNGHANIRRPHWTSELFCKAPGALDWAFSR
jgi:hypothetical protein